MKKTIHILLIIGLFLLLPKAVHAAEERCDPGENDCCIPPQIMEDGGGCPSGTVWIGAVNSGSCQTPVSCTAPQGLSCATNTCYSTGGGGPSCSSANVSLDENNCIKPFKIFRDPTDTFLKIWDDVAGILGRMVYVSDADCEEGEVPTWDNTGKVWACTQPVTDTDVGCAEGQVLSWDDTAGEWTCGDKNFTYFQDGIEAGEIYYDGGNVGIGTNNPGATLDVAGNTDADINLGRAVIGHADTFVDFASFSHIDNNTNTDYALGQSAAGDTYLNSKSGKSIYFYENGTNQMILTGGKLGIGLTDPDYKLHVENSTIYDSVNPDYLGIGVDSREYFGIYAQAKGVSGDMGAPPLYVNIGVKGVANEANSHSNIGIFGEAANGVLTGAGVYGSGLGSMYGVQGVSEDSAGVYGKGGIYGVNGVGGIHGVNGIGDDYGVYGYSSSGKGVYGGSNSGYAGYFFGDVNVTGNLEIDSLGVDEFINHNYDADTYLQFENNTLNFIGEGKELFRSRGTAQAYAYLGNSTDDIDIALNDDLFVRGSDGSVGIGTISPTFGLKLDVEGKVGATEYCDNTGANCIAAAALGGGGGLWGENGADIYYDSGKVGIGTNAPIEPLHVAGDSMLVGDGTNSIFRILGDYGTGVFLQAGETRTNGSTKDMYFSGMLGSPIHMVIKADGKVGIGTSSPSSQLHVNAASGDPLRVQVGGNTRFFVGDNGGVTIGTYEDNPPDRGLYVYGDVGIGTTSPSGKLHVFNGSNGTVLNLSGSNDDLDFRFGDTNYGFYWRYKGTGSGADNKLEFWTDGNAGADVQVYDIDQNGNFNLHKDILLWDGAEKARIWRTSSALGFSVNDTGADITIDEQGEVGIGASPPDYKLDVAGTGRFSGLLIAGGGLTLEGDILKITSCPAGYTYVGNGSGICIRNSNMFANNYGLAQKQCYAEGGHICRYDEYYISNTEGILRNPDNLWLGDQCGDNCIMCGNKSITSFNDSDLDDFDGTCGKSNHNFYCCISYF